MKYEYETILSTKNVEEYISQISTASIPRRVVATEESERSVQHTEPILESSI